MDEQWAWYRDSLPQLKTRWELQSHFSRCDSGNAQKDEKNLLPICFLKGQFIQITNTGFCHVDSSGFAHSGFEMPVFTKLQKQIHVLPLVTYVKRKRHFDWQFMVVAHLSASDLGMVVTVLDIIYVKISSLRLKAHFTELSTKSKGVHQPFLKRDVPALVVRSHLSEAEGSVSGPWVGILIQLLIKRTKINLHAIL